jgi:hypothetical protein
MKKYQHLNNSLDYHMKADLTLIGYTPTLYIVRHCINTVFITAEKVHIN